MNTLFFKRMLPAVACVMVLSAAAQDKKVAAPMKDVNHVTDNTLDSLNKVRTARPEAGSSRKGDHPVLFLVGNSTMRTGTLGNGNNGQWGWGYYAPDYFDEEKITVENQALGGTSSRTFYNRLWPDVLKGVRAGDWVLVELGHNDNGPYDSGRARASIPGIGNDSLTVVIKETGAEETVYTYGEYMRRFVREVKAKGAHPILCSLTPRNAWEDADSTIVTRVNRTFGLWAKQVAESEGVPFIDLNEISACKFERFGKEKVKTLFYIDRIHTSRFGARVNAESAIEGDFVLIQFGHNDGGDIHKGKARGELKGSGDESKVFRMEATKQYKVVYTYGWYLRKFIMDAKEKGAIPIVVSHTPRNKWKEGQIERNTDTYGKWAREAAERAGAYFIDLNKLSADKLQKKGEKKAAVYFRNDHTHTSLKGAKLNAQSVTEGLKESTCPLKAYLK